MNLINPYTGRKPGVLPPRGTPRSALLERYTWSTLSTSAENGPSARLRRSDCAASLRTMKRNAEPNLLDDREHLK